MEIRLADQNDDVYEISNIYEQSWKYAYKDIIPQSYLDSIPRGKWVNGMGKPGISDYVAVQDGRLAGTARICASRWDKYPSFGEIVSIYLLPEYMGKGIGHALFERCLDELHSSGYDDILLWVLEENHHARRFYEKHGFVLYEDTLDDNIGGKDLTEIMYVLNKK